MCGLCTLAKRGQKQKVERDMFDSIKETIVLLSSQTPETWRILGTAVAVIVLFALVGLFFTSQDIIRKGK